MRKLAFVPISILVLMAIPLSAASFAMGEAPDEQPKPSAEAISVNPATPEAEAPASPEAKAVEAIPAPPEVAPATAKSAVFYKVVVGIYTKKANALSARDKLKAEGYSAFLIEQAGGLFRVQVGAFKDKVRAESAANSLRAKGYVADVVLSD